MKCLVEEAKRAAQHGEEDDALRMRMVSNMTSALLRQNPEMQASMEAILTSIILESWLFFEALCSDMWVAAVDSGGPIICARIIGNQAWESGKEQMLASSTIQIQSNAKTHPGSYRREIGQVSFQKLRSIKHYFKIAFTEKASRLFDNTAGGYIYLLSAVRNCITHSAGKLDHMFKAAIDNRFTEFTSMNLGDQLSLDGEVVKHLRNASIETGIALLQCVDEVLLKGD